jgi:hypothetical protein
MATPTAGISEKLRREEFYEERKADADRTADDGIAQSRP